MGVNVGALRSASLSLILITIVWLGSLSLMVVGNHSELFEARLSSSHWAVTPLTMFR